MKKESQKRARVYSQREAGVLQGREAPAINGSGCEANVLQIRERLEDFAREIAKLSVSNAKTGQASQHSHVDKLRLTDSRNRSDAQICKHRSEVRRKNTQKWTTGLRCSARFN